MKVKLYKPFEHWYHGGSIIVISDTHFDDFDCKLMDPDWISPEEHVKLINGMVGKNDTLIHLGDVGNVEFVRNLKGYKVLITGNHDSGATTYLKKYWIEYSQDNGNTWNRINTVYDSRQGELQKDLEYMKADKESNLFRVKHNGLFDEVYDGPLFINEKILLSHEEIDLPFGINIHGHNHGGKPVNVVENKSAKFNMAANVIGYKPQRLDKIIEGYRVNDIHRQTIDRATENPLHKKGA